MGLGGFPQPDAFPASSASPQPVDVSTGLPQAAVPLSTHGLEGELLLPHPDGASNQSEADSWKTLDSAQFINNIYILQSIKLLTALVKSIYMYKIAK